MTGAAGAGGAEGHRIAFIGEILLQQRHVRLEVPWMVGACETSEGDTQRVLASSPGPEVPVPMEPRHAR